MTLSQFWNTGASCTLFAWRTYRHIAVDTGVLYFILNNACATVGHI